MTEANAEARKILRDAITEKEQLIGDVRRVQALLRSALAVVDEPAPDEADDAETRGRRRRAAGEARPRAGPSSPRAARRAGALPPATRHSEGSRKLAG